MRLVPVMLALLLALSPGAVAVQASAPTTPASSPSPTVADRTDATGASDGDNTTTVMTLGTAPVSTAFDSPSLALGSSLAMDRDGFRTRLSVGSLDRQLETASTVEKKKRILNRYRYRIENRIISLEAREQQVTAAFSNGTISAREYLRALGRIDIEARETRNMINSMQKRSGDILSLSTEADTLRGKLALVEGPVRNRIGRMIRGEANVTEVYVSTSKNGVVLSTIVDDTYVREIVRNDHRDPSATPNLSPIEAQRAVYDRYPWARANLKGANTFQYGSTNVISVSVSHPHGELIAYLDVGTEAVFKEVQRKQLTGETSLPPGPGVSNASGNVTLAVNRTYPGGPLRVELTNATGSPLQGKVTVDGDPIGRTNPNGVLWTLGPVNPFRVSATYNDTTVNVTTTPVELDR